MPEHGGARMGAGRKKKPIRDRIKEGNVSHRPLKVLNFSSDVDKKVATSVPKVSKHLTEAQACGIKLHVKEVFDAAWKWIDDRGCANFIPHQLLERYAMATARWVQCEQAISKFGLLTVQQKTNKRNQETVETEIPSPYATLADRYLSQANRLWTEIFQIIRENCLTDYSGATPQEDVMEKLLRSPKKENVV